MVRFSKIIDHVVESVSRSVADGETNHRDTEPAVDRAVSLNDTPAASSLDLEAEKLVERFIAETVPGSTYWECNPKDYKSGQAILDSSCEMRVRVVVVAMRELRDIILTKPDRSNRIASYDPLLQALMREALPFTETDLNQILLSLALGMDGSIYGIAASQFASSLPINTLLSILERRYKQLGSSDLLHRSLLSLRSTLEIRPSPSAERRCQIRRIDALLGNTLEFPFEKGEAWSDAVLAELSNANKEDKSAWRALLDHCNGLNGARPSEKWKNEAYKRIEAVGHEQFKARMIEWLPLAGRNTDRRMSDVNRSTLRGMVWCCGLHTDLALSRTIADVAEACYRKIPGIGAMAGGVGNACVTTLSEMSGMEPIAQLTRLNLRIKNRSDQELIEMAIKAAALKAGLPAQDLEEIVIPTYGLDESGRLREEIGDYIVEIEVQGAVSSEMRWFTNIGKKDGKKGGGNDGKLRKSVPTSIKRDHDAEFRAIRCVADDIAKMLPAQRKRIEGLLMSEREWPLAVWQQRYLNHPLIGSMSRRLIWHFSDGERTASGLWHEGRLVDSEGQPLKWLDSEDESIRVRLWHPIGFAPEVVLGWRIWLEEHGVVQPFKQAHREIYILTDAELNTGTYSNRFAAHVIKQHQFSALCRQRGWKYALQGAYDSPDQTATLAIPEWNLRAEFWTNRPWGSGEFTEAGIFLHVLSDQVRFYNQQHVQLPLTEVPALVFTEVMRDVDLFVGVASIGNDPGWTDRGGDRRYVDYWERYSSGELNESAVTRKEFLSRLLPRLKIARRCSLDGKFLTVRGDIRTYKIHLGSGNILMAPNDQYLCIVPGRSASDRKETDTVLLPFEGDTTLSLIISKAFLLAEDTKITDATILTQIKQS